MKKVTVIIPNWNGMKFLPVCVEALKKQSYQDFETLIIDNASTDESVSWLKDHYPEAILVENRENLGFSGAVNQGIRMSKCPYVLLLNNDTEVTPDFIANLVKAIERKKKIFSVSAKMIQFHDRTKMDDAGDLYCLLGWAFQRGVGQSAEGYNRRCRVFSACAGAAIYRREVFDEIGLFDLKHFAYLEDIDVGYRAQIAGYENWYEPTAVVYHVGSGTSGSKYNDFKVKLAIRNNFYLNYKNMPLLQRGLNYLPIQLGIELKRRFFRKIGYLPAYEEGIKEGLATRKECSRVPFRMGRLLQYVWIELQLIGNTFIYAYDYLRRR